MKRKLCHISLFVLSLCDICMMMWYERMCASRRTERNWVQCIWKDAYVYIDVGKRQWKCSFQASAKCNVERMKCGGAWAHGAQKAPLKRSPNNDVMFTFVQVIESRGIGVNNVSSAIINVTPQHMMGKYNEPIQKCSSSVLCVCVSDSKSVILHDETWAITKCYFCFHWF